MTVTNKHYVDGDVHTRAKKLINYIDYYAIDEKNKNYIVLKKVLDKFNVAPRSLLYLINESITEEMEVDMIKGRFIFEPSKIQLDLINEYARFQEYTISKKLRPLSMFRNRYFLRAFRWLYLTNKFARDIFYERLDERWHTLKPQVSTDLWYSLLLSIYNFNRKTNLLKKQFVSEPRCKRNYAE